VRRYIACRNCEAHTSPYQSTRLNRYDVVCGAQGRVMRRRDFLGVLGGVAAGPIAARAQQSAQIKRIGFLMPFAADDPEGQARIAAFLQGMQALGWAVGRNVHIEYRWGATGAERVRKFSAELIALAPDVILAQGSSTVGALLQETRDVPIVFPLATDPVGGGLVDSLSRPGGNVTGKWLELLKEVCPNVMRVAVLRDPTLPSGIGQSPGSRLRHRHSTFR
jgi:putative ABC transport system substrate-binding protein